MEQTLKEGDVVKLKSEKYNKMTIGAIGNDMARCYFFDKDGVFKEVSINLAALVKTTAPS